MEVRTLTRKLFTCSLPIQTLDAYIKLTENISNSNYRLLDFRQSENIAFLILKIGHKLLKLTEKEAVYADFQNLHLVQMSLATAKDKPAILPESPEQISQFKYDTEYTM